MSRTPLTLAEANLLVQPLIGLPVSLPWKGYGSAIFLELGNLTPSKRLEHHNEGEACIYIEWDWRVEGGSTIQYGSSNSRPDIKRGIEHLRGASIEKILIHGQVPELLIQFSNAQRLMSAAMVTGDPEWSIKLPDTNWVSCEGGVVYVGDGSGTETTAEEKITIAHAESTAERWGAPVAEPIEGRCNNCKWFVRIDGDFDLLDFGACTSSTSTFDGRIVNVKSGCGAFLNDET